MNALRKFGKVAGAFILVAAAAVAAYLIFLRPWDRTWGATGAERAAFMPGDQLVADPSYVTTRAVNVTAAPEEIWPWLVQMGYKRGGLYSYDWIDRLLGILDRPSATRIMPEFQNLQAGETIPIGGSPGWPVSSLDPGRFLILNIQQDPVHISWSFGLKPLNARASRLVLRIRGRMRVKPMLTPFFALMDVGEFPMVRKMLTGIRDRVEGDPQTPTEELIELGLWAMAILVGLIAAVLAFFRRQWLRLFVLSWLSLAAVLYMAFIQPQLWVGAVLDAVLGVWLMMSFGRKKKKIKII
jgi:hypothetical protein